MKITVENMGTFEYNEQHTQTTINDYSLEKEVNVYDLDFIELLEGIIRRLIHIKSVEIEYSKEGNRHLCVTLASDLDNVGYVFDDLVLFHIVD